MEYGRVAAWFPPTKIKMAFLRTLPGDRNEFFDEAHAAAAGASLHEDYVRASPFPHAVIDDFLPEHLAERFLADFPPPAMARVHRMEAVEYDKRGWRPDDLGDRSCRSLFYGFNSRPFLAFLE